MNNYLIVKKSLSRTKKGIEYMGVIEAETEEEAKSRAMEALDISDDWMSGLTVVPFGQIRKI